MLPGKQAILFANGEIDPCTEIKHGSSMDELIIAVDGGLRHCLHYDLRPDLLIGDLDSVDPAEVQQLASLGVQVEKFPVEKDETDLELAVLRALEMGAQNLILFGGLGGRLDHTLGNLSLLFHPRLIHHSIRFLDGKTEIFAISEYADLAGKAGDLVSLIPWGGNAEGVSTHGLVYPLKNETLFHYHTRGISNVMLADTASVSVKGGTLLCVVTHSGAASA